MKKTNFLALLMAIALASTFSLSACSSSDEVTSDNAEPNPTYDGTSVRTDFAFSITKASSTTRMTAANTQNNNNFLGISDMHLFPFTGVPGTATKTNLSTENGAPANYFLGSLSTSDISSATAGPSSKVYTLSIPVGTDNFLFYGKATNSGTNFEKGALTSTITNTTSAINDISFALNSIKTSLGVDATNIAKYLNDIAGAKYIDNTTDPSNPQTTKWSDALTKRGTDANYSSLADMYTKFTTNIVDYSGSTESIQRLVFDLYKSAYAINAQSTNTVVQNIAKDICSRIESNGTVSLSVDNGSGTAIKIIDFSPEIAATAGSWKGTLSGVNAKFPDNLGLPMGSALIKWTGTEFVYVDNPLYTTDITTVGSSTSTEKYCYPAELIYFDNSPLRATDSYKKVSDYPTSAANWDADLGTSASSFSTDWDKTSVSSLTRAVAMRNNVNYGVAVLETTVALSTGVTTLTDNKKAILGGGDNQTSLDPSKYTVTGLLIGGQPASVDWDMTNPGDNFAHVIYDNSVVYNKALSAMTSTDKNYTIVLDNYRDAGNPASDQKDVRIALQLVNNGDDFYGKDGLIPAGSTFYLLGDLTLSGAGSHTIPDVPDGSGGTVKRNNSSYRITAEEQSRVFIQDYKTVANITILQNALQKAYSVIPDLRSTEVLFGLSVDLTWQPGLTFDVKM